MQRTVLLAAILMVVAGCSRRETAGGAPETAASPPPAPTAEPAPAEPIPSESPPAPADGAVAPAGEEVACNAEPAQRFVGEIYTPELGEEARVAASARVQRALRPGQIVTMEFQFDRLTLTLDESGRISAASCG